MLAQIAHCPFLLLDIAFNDPTRWQISEDDRVAMTRAVLPVATDPLQTRLENLARAACFLAWHLARNDAIAARLALGATAQTAATIARLSLPDLLQIATCEVHRGQVRPRWHDRPDVWHRLIYVARSSEYARVAPVTAHGLQFFLWDLLAQDQEP
ncbi:hypothetical protein [Peristeroidobacter soli]|uniref:hypothetical protein n=1 Tax=Peristeroidobacter soli TaxID=2497877 RepID=UPI001300695B|nr:hypothetical protein [Peristeroidobacter soli]